MRVKECKLTHLHCDANKAEKVELDQTDHDLVELVHCCRVEDVSSYISKE